MASKTISMSRLYRKYKPLIIRHMNEIRAEFASEGFRVDEPFEMSDEEYQWTMIGGPEGSEPSFDDDKCFSIDLTIVEERIRDGDDKAMGIAFSLNMIGYGGEIIGGCTPYNYSPDLFVSRRYPEAVLERWRLFEDATNPAEVVAVAKSHYKKKS